MPISLDEPFGARELEREIVSTASLLRDLEGLGGSAFPTSPDLATAPRLADWALAVRPILCLEGTASGHPRMPGSRLVVTSPIIAISYASGFARTRNRFYILERSSRGRADA